MSTLEDNSAMINEESSETMESFGKMIVEFDNGLDDTTNIESVLNFEVSDLISKIDDNTCDRLIISRTQSSDGTSVTYISKNDIAESIILKNIDNHSNDDYIDKRDNNFAYAQDQMSAENENLDQDLKLEESLCTQCKVDTKLSDFDSIPKDLILETGADLSDNEVHTPGGKNLSKLMNRVIDLLGCQDKVSEIERTMHCHPSSGVLATPIDRHPRFTYNLMSESTPKKNSSLQLFGRFELSSKDLFNQVVDVGKDNIGRIEFGEKYLPRKRFLPQLNRNSTIHVMCDLFGQSQDTSLSNLNKSISAEESTVSIKRKRFNNNCERTEPVIFARSLSMRTTKQNVEPELNFSQVQQCVELIDLQSSNYNAFGNKYSCSDRLMIKNTPINNVFTLGKTSSAGDKLEWIQSVGNKLNYAETSNSGTCCTFPSRVFGMNVDEKSVNVVLETSIIDESEEIQNRKDVRTKSFVRHIEDPVKDIDSVKEGKLNENVIDLINTGNSFLDISVESELERIEKESIIRKAERSKSTKKIINVPSAENPSELNTESQVERNSSCIGNSEKKNTIAENTEPTNASSDLDGQFLSDTKFGKVHREREDEKIGSENINPNNFIANPTILNIVSTNDPMILNENVESSLDDFNSQFLSESQLEKIEREALKKDKEGKTSLKIAKNTNVSSIVNRKDMFYKPDNVNSVIEEHYDTLPIPYWITNPAPEPNYNKMRNPNRMRREFIRKMLREIFRLSTIITKMESIINEKPQKGNFQLESLSSSQIPNTHPVSHVKKNPQNGPANSGTFASINMNVNCSNNVAKNSEKSNVFYVPELSESNGYIPSVFTNVLNPHHQLVNFGASSSNTGTIDAEVHRDLPQNLKAKEKFHKLQTIGISKHDSPVIFNDRSNVKYGTSNVLNNCKTKFVNYHEDSVYHNASNVFGSLKDNLNDSKAHDFAARSIRYNEEEKENKIREKLSGNTDILEKSTKLENFNVPVSHENNLKVIENSGKMKNNAKPVIDIFYSPEEPSSPSASNDTSIKNNYTQSFDTKNIAKVFLHNSLTTQSLSCYTRLNKLGQPNLRSNFTSLQARRAKDNGIFFNGNTE